MIVLVVSWYDHLFFMSYFLLSPPFIILIISWYLYFYNDIMIFLFPYIIYILVFVSFAAFIHIFIFWYMIKIFLHMIKLFLWKLLGSAFFCFLFKNREYNSGNFYTTPCFCLRFVNNLQNTKYTKYKIFRRLQNTKYKIYFLYWQNFLFGTLQNPFK